MPCKDKAAKAAANRRWKAANPDKVLAGHRRYYERNRERILQRARASYAMRRANDPTVPDCKDCTKRKSAGVGGRCGPCHLDYESEVIALRTTGLSYAEIGDVYGGSGERIRQIVTELAPHLTGRLTALRKALR